MTLARKLGIERPERLLAGLVVLALAGRVAAVLATPGYAPEFDAEDYDRYAASLAETGSFPSTGYEVGGPTAFRPPLYPLLLAGVYELTGARWTAGRLAGALLGALAVVLVYLVARRLWGRREALVAGALAAAFPPLVLTGVALVSEPLFVVLELAVVLAVLVQRTAARPLPWAVAAGALCGLGALTRANGALLVVPAALGVWAVRPRLSARALAAPAVVVAAAALTVAPWTVRNAIVLDAFVPVSTQAGVALAGTYNDQSRGFDPYKGTWVLPEKTRMYGPLFAQEGLNEAGLERELRSRALRFARDHPGYVLELAWLNTARLLELAPASPHAIDADRRQRGLSEAAAGVSRWSLYAALLLALAGAAVLWRRGRGRRGPGFVWLVPVLMTAAAVPIVAIPRYQAPLYPFLVLLAAVALVDAHDRTWRWRRGGGAAPPEAEPGGAPPAAEPEPAPESEGAAAVPFDLRAVAGARRLCDWMFAQLAAPGPVRGHVAEVGAGIGTFSERILAAGAERLLAVEPDPACAAELERRFGGDPRVEIAREELPGAPSLAAGGFDLVVCQNVLEHVRDDAAAVETMAAALAPGGRLALLVPAHPRLYNSLDTAYGHHRRYTPQRLGELAEGAGLEVTALRHFNLLGVPGWWLKGRLRARGIGRASFGAYEALLLPWAPIERRLRPRWGLSLILHARKA